MVKIDVKLADVVRPCIPRGSDVRLEGIFYRDERYAIHLSFIDDELEIMVRCRIHRAMANIGWSEA